MTDPDDALARVVREEWGRLIALLLARFRRLDFVEDALGDAVEAAARTWPRDGAPANPAAWLMTTASRRVLDRLRSEAMAQRKHPLLLVEEVNRPQGGLMADDGTTIEDDLLRLVLMCTHPALAPDVAAALALRLVLGVSTADIARLFLVSEPTMAARLTRGKKKIVTAGIPFALPSASDLPSRLGTVAHIAYLAFTAGYAAGSGPDLMRTSLAGEAIRLIRVLRALVPPAVPSHELSALLALMLLQHSRRDARVDDTGDLVLLPEQDRSRWHRDEMAEAMSLVGSVPVMATRQSESYRLQALIAAEHAMASSSRATAWHRIVTIYDRVLEVFPSPPARLARAVAVAEADGPAVGLDSIDDLTAKDLPGHRLPAVRAELLGREGNSEGARAAYQLAISLCDNETERRHLAVRLGGLAE